MPINNCRDFPKGPIRFCNFHLKTEVCIVQLFGYRGGGMKPVPLEYFGEENLYLRNFPYFWAKIEPFFLIFRKIVT